MQSIEQTLISFFARVAQKNQPQLIKLEQEQCFSVEQGRWCFTLPALFSFLRRHDDIFNCIDYSQFRQLIFNSQLNYTVKLYGAEINIANNQKKVDLSTYALIWQEVN